MNAQLPVVQKAALVAGNRPVAIVPQSIEEVWRFAQVVAESGMAPKGMEKPEMITVAIMHGLEVGLTPLMALQRIAIINGRPTIWGDAAMALVRSSGLCEMVAESTIGDGDALHALCTVKRTGEAENVSRTFSVADAKKAGLWGKSGPWTQYPKRMLQMRARAFALRDVFADVLGGMYLREELDNGNGDHARDVTPEPPTPPEPPAIDATKIAGEAMHQGPAEITADGTNRASASDRGQPAPDTKPTPSPTPKMEQGMVDALGGPIPPSDDVPVPPGLRRTKGPPPFKLDAWMATLKKECEDKTPAQLLDLRTKMIEPLRDRLGHDGYNKAGDVLGAAMEIAQKKYAPGTRAPEKPEVRKFSDMVPAKPAFDADAWYNDLSGAISGCTTIEQIIKIQEAVQKPALELVSREHYARGKALVKAALMQLSDED